MACLLYTSLAREGVCVVSGLARGVDTCAHEGALEGGGATIAVLGSGADVIYPPENEELAARILEKGGAIVSEYAPGTRPSQGTFPARNRIISGLCGGVLMVEGSHTSGAVSYTHLAGYAFYIDSPTNQQFPIFPDEQLARLGEKYAFSYQCRVDEARSAVRICTSWATRAEDVDRLISDIRRG